MIDFTSEVSHSAGSAVVFTSAAWTTSVHSHLCIFVEQPIALFPERIVVAHIDTFKRRLFQFLDFVQNLSLQSCILLRVLKLLLQSLVRYLLCLDFLVFRVDLILHLPFTILLLSLIRSLFFFQLFDPRLLLLDLFLEQFFLLLSSL
mmetsp:Transcript_21436/g.25141  ORF Transcript_21436/g.25141 Transcript_21436/m.25141 type:complete len:147 (+) Transcript_21436:74-514(+)